MAEITEKILLVDDEPNVLRASERLLHDKFETDAACGGAEALNALKTSGPYAVVVSDMRMPQMDGLQLLTRVKAAAPDTIRIMLTGYADVQTALTAVNEGNIFRLLTKPCSKQTLVTALTAAIAQYRLVNSEKELLERTLAGSLGVLSDVLSMASPAAFSRALRLRRYMAHIADKLALANRWKFELAATLSQLGCVTLAPDTIDAVYAGRQLPPKEQALYDAHSQIACDLLKNIPRLDAVVWMIAHQNDFATAAGDVNDPKLVEMRLGAELLQAVLDFDSSIRQGISRTEAACLIGRRHSGLDQQVTMALVEVEPEANEKNVQTCKIEDLSPGMMIDQDIRARDGLLIIARNQEVTSATILKLKNYFEKGAIEREIKISEKRAAAAASK